MTHHKNRGLLTQSIYIIYISMRKKEEKKTRTVMIRIYSNKQGYEEEQWKTLFTNMIKTKQWNLFIHIWQQKTIHLAEYSALRLVSLTI